MNLCIPVTGEVQLIMQTGIIFLPTASAVALWNKEILGQMSDGMWENTAPYDHWVFWRDLEVQLTEGQEPRVHTMCASTCRKTGYNIAALYPIIGERMLQIGKDAVGPEYDMRALKGDVASIKKAMKTVVR